MPLLIVSPGPLSSGVGWSESQVVCVCVVLVHVHVVLAAFLDRQDLQGAGLWLGVGEGLEFQGNVLVPVSAV